MVKMLKKTPCTRSSDCVRMLSEVVKFLLVREGCDR